MQKYILKISVKDNIIESLVDFRVIKEINSILENKNISIVILDKNRNIIFDSKGYDLNEEAFQNKSPVTLENELEKTYLPSSYLMAGALYKKNKFWTCWSM